MFGVYAAVHLAGRVVAQIVAPLAVAVQPSEGERTGGDRLRLERLDMEVRRHFARQRRLQIVVQAHPVDGEQFTVAFHPLQVSSIAAQRVRRCADHSEAFARWLGDEAFRNDLRPPTARDIASVFAAQFPYLPCVANAQRAPRAGVAPAQAARTDTDIHHRRERALLQANANQPVAIPTGRGVPCA
jgi:hypothetical protein